MNYKITNWTGSEMKEEPQKEIKWIEPGEYDVRIKDATFDAASDLYTIWIEDIQTE